MLHVPAARRAPSGHARDARTHLRRSSALAAATLVAGLACVAPTASAVDDEPSVATSRDVGDADGLQQELDRLVEDGAPGALLYTYDHGTVTTLQSGQGDLEAGAPIAPDDTYRIGSLTKTYVSTALLQLVAEHRVDLDDAAGRYVPALLRGEERVTLRQLLNHTSGLYDFNNDPRVLAPYLDGDLGHVWTPRRLVEIALSHDPVARPGTAYHYSNTNYVLAGLVVQAVTGRRLDDVLRRRVFAPAHLTSTTLGMSASDAPAIHGYFVFSGDRPTDITDLYPYPWASGSVVSTAPEVARFYRHLLAGRLLPRRLMAEMRTTVDASAEDGPGTAYGLGLERFATPCGAAWGHGGNFPGYVTYAYSSPDGRHQAVLLVNMDPSSLQPSVGRGFLHLLDRAYCSTRR